MIKRITINGDLRKERTTCTFDVEELTNFLDGGVEITDKKRKLGTATFYIHTHWKLINI